mgnify:CR=1 FL=1
MAVHWGGRGPGHVSRGGGTGLSGDVGPPLGTPALIMDFAPSDADSDWVALDLNFMTETYEVYVPDAGVTDRVNILLWS